MRHTLIAGNWKLNGSLADNQVLIDNIAQGVIQLPDSVELLVCPPAVYLSSVKQAIGTSSIQLGAQNASLNPCGAFTGEISPVMLADLGVQYVILGHSERRELFGETDAMVASKTRLAAESGVRPIICVGESEAQREAGETEAVIGQQLDAVVSSLSDADIKALNVSDWVIAYEPVWAIGTGKTATPDMAQAVHVFIRQKLHAQLGEIADKIRILYGGSMKPQNAQALLEQADIDGGLIGGASLNAADFLAIANAVRG